MLLPCDYFHAAWSVARDRSRPCAERARARELARFWLRILRAKLRHA